LPLNQRASAVVTATISDSDPIPKMNRPVAITQNSPESAVTTAPVSAITANRAVDFRVPIRSMMIPPISTITMFGTL